MVSGLPAATATFSRNELTGFTRRLTFRISRWKGNLRDDGRILAALAGPTNFCDEGQTSPTACLMEGVGCCSFAAAVLRQPCILRRPPQAFLLTN
jgi:hypothetical protein